MGSFSIARHAAQHPKNGLIGRGIWVFFPARLEPGGNI
jgi:hypothetical protein